jgi:hypothetical protein
VAAAAADLSGTAGSCAEGRAGKAKPVVRALKGRSGACAGSCCPRLRAADAAGADAGAFVGSPLVHLTVFT